MTFEEQRILSGHACPEYSQEFPKQEKWWIPFDEKGHIEFITGQDNADELLADHIRLAGVFPKNITWVIKIIRHGEYPKSHEQMRKMLQNDIDRKEWLRDFMQEKGDEKEARKYTREIERYTRFLNDLERR